MGYSSLVLTRFYGFSGHPQLRAEGRPMFIFFYGAREPRVLSSFFMDKNGDKKD